MTVEVSSSFNSLAATSGLNGTALDNVLGGSGSYTWAATGLQGATGGGKVSGTSAADAAQFVYTTAGNRKCRIRFDPNGGTSNIQMWGNRDAAGTSNYLLLLLTSSHTSLQLREGIAQTPTAGTTRATTTITAPGTTFWIELEINGLVVTARILNNDLSVRNEASFTFTTIPTGTRWGFGFANAGNTGFFDDFIIEDLVAADTIDPVLSLPTLGATSPTALDAGFTSDEAGFSWTVLTPAAQAAPSEAQIRAGQDATGAAAVASSLNTAMIVGVNTRSLTGATGGTAYKAHTISQDTATTPNVSNIVSSASETTPVPPQKATVTLYQADGTTPAASITGLQWAWWDDATPDLSLAADISGTGASTDTSGVFDVTLTGTVLTLGQTGTLLIYKTDGIAESTATLAFFGPLATVN